MRNTHYRLLKRLMLFDKPTPALDPELVGNVPDTMHSLAENGMTMVIVIHEISSNREVANCVVFMKNGYIVEDSHLEQVFGHQRRNIRVSKNFWHGCCDNSSG